MRHIAIRSVAAAAAAVIALTGCQSGGAEPDEPAATSAPAGNGVTALNADEILQRAKTALTAAKSYRIHGTMINAGQTSQLDFTIDGSDLTGTMAVGGAEVELLAVGADRYLRGNEQFFIQVLGPEPGPAASRALAQRWLSGTENDPMFASLFTIAGVDEILRPAGTLAKGEEKELGGAPAIGVTDAASNGVFWIATTGEPYPLRLTHTETNAELVISEVGVPATGIRKPADTEIIDLNQFIQR